jgi:hypothetical protein
MFPVLPLLFAACAWTPPVDTALEPEPSTLLEGTVVITQQPAAAGPGLVLLFDAANPPPPNGFGRPADVAAFTSSAWTDVDGLPTAPWQLVGVPDGTWLLTTLIDEDRDFNPFYDFTLGSTCGDRTGAYLADLGTGTPQPLTTTGPRVIDDLTLMAGAPIATERPVFELSAGGQITRPTSMEEYVAHVTDFLFTLSAVGVDHPMLQIAGPTSGDACANRFQVSLLDADGDGEPDPHENPEFAAYGLHDVWPKAYLLFGSGLDGSALQEGEAYVSEAVLYDAPFYQGGYDPGETFRVDNLPMLFLPGAVHVLPDGTQELVYLQDMPAGYWAILLEYPGGQTWVTPNQLADEDIATSFGVAALPGQGALFVVQ